MTASLVQTLDAPLRRAAGSARRPRPWLAARMPKHVADSFTEAQISALERALEERSPRKPRLDIRVSVPLFRRRAFFVFIAGSEQRSARRRRMDRRTHPLLTLANLGALLFALLFAIPGFFGLFHLLTLATAAN